MLLLLVVVVVRVVGVMWRRVGHIATAAGDMAAATAAAANGGTQSSLIASEGGIHQWLGRRDRAVGGRCNGRRRWRELELDPALPTDGLVLVEDGVELLDVVHGAAQYLDINNYIGTKTIRGQLAFYGCEANSIDLSDMKFSSLSAFHCSKRLFFHYYLLGC